jgi:toxin ParE1/3/4
VSVYRLTRRADDDILSAYLQGHALFGERQADRYHAGLHALFQQLADHPGMARLRPEITPPVRAFSFKAHVVIYEDAPEGVVILSVRHGHEDWQNDPVGSQGGLDDQT